MNTILVFDITGRNAISMNSGHKIYELISQSIAIDEKVNLDFEGVEIFASPFFNAGIGQLLKIVPIEQLHLILKIQNLDDQGKNLLSLVLTNAKEYYSKG